MPLRLMLVDDNGSDLLSTPLPFDVTLADPGAATRVPSGDAAVHALVVCFEHGDRAMRERIVAGLLRPLSPLAVAAVASGAFAPHLARAASARPTATFAGDLADHAPAQVRELARFTDQVNPQALAALLFVLAQGAGRVDDDAAAPSRKPPRRPAADA